MAVEHGVKVLDAAEAASGSQTIVTTGTSLHGDAHVCHDFGGKYGVKHKPCRVAIDGSDNLLITFTGARSGDKLCWIAYD